MEVLTAFVRERTRDGPARRSNVWTNPRMSDDEASAHPAADVQAARTVMGRRRSWDPADVALNLARTNLAGADLHGANLWSANLSNAVLAWANLRDALLVDADLACANLLDADLTGAVFLHTNMTGVDLATLDGLTDSSRKIIAANPADVTFSGPAPVPPA